MSHPFEMLATITHEMDYEATPPAETTELSIGETARKLKKQVERKLKSPPKEGKARERMRRYVSGPMEAEILHDNIFGSETRRVSAWSEGSSIERIVSGEVGHFEMEALWLAVATLVLQGAGSPEAVFRYATPDTLVITPRAYLYTPPSGRQWASHPRRAIAFHMEQVTQETGTAAGVFFVDEESAPFYFIVADDDHVEAVTNALDASVEAARSAGAFPFVMPDRTSSVVRLKSLPSLAARAANALAGDPLHDAVIPGENGEASDAFRLLWMWRVLGKEVPLPAAPLPDTLREDVKAASKKPRRSSFVVTWAAAEALKQVNSIVQTHEDVKAEAGRILHANIMGGLQALEAGDMPTAYSGGKQVGMLQRAGLLSYWSPAAQYMLKVLGASLIVSSSRVPRYFSFQWYVIPKTKAAIEYMKWSLVHAIMDDVGLVPVVIRSRLIAGLVWLAERLDSALPFPGDGQGEGVRNPDDALLDAYARHLRGDEEHADAKEAFERQTTTEKIEKERLLADAELNDVAGHGPAAIQMAMDFFETYNTPGVAERPFSGEKKRLEAARDAFDKARAPLKGNPVSVLTPWLAKLWPNLDTQVFEKAEKKLLGRVFKNGQVLIDILDWLDVRDALAIAVFERVRNRSDDPDVQRARSALETFAEERRGFEALAAVHARTVAASEPSLSRRWIEGSTIPRISDGHDLMPSLVQYTRSGPLI